MSERSRRAAAVLAAAAILGWLADALFVGQRPGLNVLLFAGCFVAALAFVLRIGRAPLHQGRRWMALPLLLFSAAFAWHDSRLLVATNLLALAGAVSLGALRRAQPKPQDATLAEYAGGLLSAGLATLAGSIELLERDISWRAATRSARSPGAAAFARGLALGVPVVAVFGALFLAADAVFRRLVISALPTIPSPWPNGVVMVGAAWASAGLLRDLAADRDDGRLVPPGALADAKPTLRLGGAEVAIVLGALDALFLAFVVVQARYLFGGGDVVLEHAHLTYAQYARHGFFDLLAVTALVVPVVLAACAVARDRVGLVRALCAVLVGLELVVAASALQRMHVYVQQYGLTELRLYATGVILWLAVVLAWAVPTILRGRGRRFAVGAVLAGFVATVALNIGSPDALIARTDLDRAKPDTAYVLRLGADAVPTLIDRLPQLDPAERRRVAGVLLRRDFGHGLVGWNASRSRARAVVERHRAELEAFSRP